MKLFDSGKCLECAALGLEGGVAGTGRRATLSRHLMLSDTRAHACAGTDANADRGRERED